MEKTSKVLVAAFTREFSGQYGTMYVHQITFENQDSGEYLSKSRDQDKFVVGQEAKYTIDASNPAYPAKIKPVLDAPQGGKSWGKSDPAKNRSIERQTALKAAVELAPLFRTEKLSEVVTMADILHAWLETPEGQKAVKETPGTPEPTAPQAENDLSF